jgi:hypothetical protein
MTEIPTDEGKLYLATVLDLFSSCWPVQPRTIQTRSWPPTRSKMATAVRCGRAFIDGVIFSH